jgi:hypothetical protein
MEMNAVNSEFSSRRRTFSMAIEFGERSAFVNVILSTIQFVGVHVLRSIHVEFIENARIDRRCAAFDLIESFARTDRIHAIITLRCLTQADLCRCQWSSTRTAALIASGTLYTAVFGAG